MINSVLKMITGKILLHGRFFEECSRGKKKFTGEIFVNDHGGFSRVTQYFWNCSRAGKKFHVQLFTEMRTRQSEASTSSLSRVCVCVCVRVCVSVSVLGLSMYKSYVTCPL